MYLEANTTLIDKNLIIEKLQIKSDQKVADFGCGQHGYFTITLAKQVGKHGQIYAIDIIKDHLETIKKIAKPENLLNISYIWSNLDIYNATKTEANSLDSGLLINVIHQSKNKVSMLSEIARLLKTNSRLVIVDWKESASPFGPDTTLRIDKEMIVTLAKKSNLILDSEFVAGQYHYGLVFIKV